MPAAQERRHHPASQRITHPQPGNMPVYWNLGQELICSFPHQDILHAINELNLCIAVCDQLVYGAYYGIVPPPVACVVVAHYEPARPDIFSGMLQV
jgi:hypothetical protein